VIDCLALAIGADPLSTVTALKTIRTIKATLGVNMTLGASNISFGMPDRILINGSYLAMIIEAGVTCPVLDAAKMRPYVLAVDLLLNKDKRARRYIQAYRDKIAEIEKNK
jgi:5-methyltetrahydrofolate--homocysteine methyltransferase